MQIFLDSCDANEIKDINEICPLDGVTTNPTLIYKSGLKIEDVIKDIAKIINGTIHIQVIEKNVSKILESAKKIASLSEKVVIKLSMNELNLKACIALRKLNIPVNITLCFSVQQAIMAAKAGANYVSVFVGRIEDTGSDGMDLIADCCNVWQNYPDITSYILAASIRNPTHVAKAAMIGVDIVTLSPAIVSMMIKHPLTNIGMQIFNDDWDKSLNNDIKNNKKLI